MVAADDIYLQLSLCKRGQKAVQQFHRLLARHRLIIYIPGYDDSIRLLIIDDAQNLFQYIFLILQHGKFIYTLSYVKIR